MLSSHEILIIRYRVSTPASSPPRPPSPSTRTTRTLASQPGGRWRRFTPPRRFENLRGGGAIQLRPYVDSYRLFNGNLLDTCVHLTGYSMATYWILELILPVTSRQLTGYLSSSSRQMTKLYLFTAPATNHQGGHEANRIISPVFSSWLPDDEPPGDGSGCPTARCAALGRGDMVQV
jgi:hypothetical protein